MGFDFEKPFGLWLFVFCLSLFPFLAESEIVTTMGKLCWSLLHYHRMFWARTKKQQRKKNVTFKNSQISLEIEQKGHCLHNIDVILRLVYRKCGDFCGLIIRPVSSGSPARQRFDNGNQFSNVNKTDQRERESRQKRGPAVDVDIVTNI